MVMELIRDNRKIVDRITHDHIDKFVDLLRRDKNYRYLDLLSVLCVCDGVSIADNQKYITEVWLMKGVKVQYVSIIDTRGIYHYQYIFILTHIQNVSENDQEIPQSHTADQPTAPRGRAIEHLFCLEIGVCVLG